MLAQRYELLLDARFGYAVSQITCSVNVLPRRVEWLGNISTESKVKHSHSPFKMRLTVS